MVVDDGLYPSNCTSEKKEECESIKRAKNNNPVASENMKPTLKIAHVCLIVSDLSRSIEFYEKIGCCMKFEFKRNQVSFGAYLEISPGNFIELFESCQQSISASPGGIAHFCLETEDLDGFIAHCQNLGICTNPKKIGCDHTWQVWLKDPDGYEFEVHQYTSKSSQKTGESVEADW